MSYRIWLTRPREDSEFLAARLHEQGIDSYIMPVLHIAPRAVSLPEATRDAVLLTSRHAAHALPVECRELPTFCVGAATAQAARAAGYTNLIGGHEDVVSLLPHIAKQLRPGSRLLYLCSTDIRVDVAPLLAAQDIAVERVIAYDAVAESTLPKEFRAKLEQGHINGAAFFSPRSAEIACGLLQREGMGNNATRIDAFCNSFNTAEAAGRLPWHALHMSPIPTADAMFAMMASIAS